MCAQYDRGATRNTLHLIDEDRSFRGEGTQDRFVVNDFFSNVYRGAKFRECREHNIYRPSNPSAESTWLSK